MKTIEQLTTDLDMLTEQRAEITRQINSVIIEMSRMRKEAHPHKVGDIVKDSLGRECRVHRVIANHDDVFMLINRRTPSGRWSKKSSTYWGPQ